MNNLNLVVLGAQWGDEGKGRLVDWLAGQADIVARFNGGHNAGHTIVIDGKSYKLSLLPSGLVRGKKGVIGNGVVIEPNAFFAEISRMREMGVDVTPDNLTIAETACLVLPIHKIVDQEQEKRRKNAIGTTLRGIGPAYEDKVGRRAIRICDLASPKLLEEKLDMLLAHHNAWLKGGGAETVEKQPILDELLKFAPELLSYSGPVWSMLDKAMNDGESILFEGSQAVMLDVDWGSYPYVTSSGTLAASAASGTGVGVNRIGSVLGVSKCYATRVGEGPFPTELADELGQFLQSEGKEFGVNTGRPRRCGWLDIVQLKQAIKVSGMSSIALTKLDVLDQLKLIKVCVAYEISGRISDLEAFSSPKVNNAKPIYEEFSGWECTTQGISSFFDLPEKAKQLIKRIEDLIEIPISIVTTGPDRLDTIVLRDPKSCM
ncbi:adenylosuccinate synthase [Pseudomonas chlororaphis]|uniref:adenylosuccinate synthase n=1 Tax=Pseudomonas chlororaphis TaxID=587753 RepID=UPI002365BF71|nr:adenylosuccinate synthase [Pseudomonas chlororaphis]WDH24425.1 adenylosuccinate synthase [Pseudomonas chlororaphis]